MDPTAHDVATRVAADRETGVTTACLSLSAPLGIERLRRPEAQPLIDAWHRGVRELPDHFRAWASVPSEGADVAASAGCWPRTASSGCSCRRPTCSPRSPGSARRTLLLAAELAGKPVFVHPGPEPRRVLAGRLPTWWAPVVGYTAQLQAAWWGWHALRRALAVPATEGALRCRRRARARASPSGTRCAAGRTTVDPDVFVDTSGYRRRALEAVVRVLGIDALVLGQRPPVRRSAEEFLGDAATHAVRVANPGRLSAGTVEQGGELEWAVAS